MIFQNMEHLLSVCGVTEIARLQSLDQIARERTDVCGKLNAFLVYLAQVDLVSQIHLEPRKRKITSHLEAFVQSLDAKAALIGGHSQGEARVRTHSGDVSHLNGQNHYRVAQELFAEITQDLNDNISQFPTKTSYDYQSDFQTLAPEFERKIRTLIAQCEKVASWAASCSETEGRTVQTFLSGVSELQIRYERWRRDLRQTITDSELDRQTDKSGLLPTIELVPFAGYTSRQSIYEFLKKFNEVYAPRLPSSVERATLLYERCLSEELQLEFSSVSRDYAALASALQRNYGDSEKILAYYFSSLSEIKTKGESMQSYITYLKEVYSAIKRMENVVVSAGESGSNLHSELYQRRSVNEMAKVLRRLKGGLFDKFQRKLSDALSTAEINGTEYNWQDGVRLFLIFLQKEWSYLQTNIDSRNNGVIVEANKFGEKLI